MYTYIYIYTHLCIDINIQTYVYLLYTYIHIFWHAYRYSMKKTIYIYLERMFLFMYVHVKICNDIPTVPVTCTHIHMPPTAPLKAAGSVPACLPASVWGVLTSLCASSSAVPEAAAALCSMEASRARGGVGADASVPCRCEHAWYGTLRGLYGALCV